MASSPESTKWRDDLLCRIGHAETPSEAADLAADFVIRTLADALDCHNWHGGDGSETWDGDVAGTVYNILHAARVLHPETNEVARHAE